MSSFSSSLSSSSLTRPLGYCGEARPGLINNVMDKYATATNIFQYLNIKDTCDSSAVSHGWNKISNYPKLWSISDPNLIEPGTKGLNSEKSKFLVTYSTTKRKRDEILSCINDARVRISRMDERVKILQKDYDIIVVRGILNAFATWSILLPVWYFMPTEMHNSHCVGGLIGIYILASTSVVIYSTVKKVMTAGKYLFDYMSTRLESRDKLAALERSESSELQRLQLTLNEMKRYRISINPPIIQTPIIKHSDVMKEWQETHIPLS